jgi:hypothetical protein
MIIHHPSCSPNYPEKPKGEPPQATVDIPISDISIARTCVDCGAFELVDKEKK